MNEAHHFAVERSASKHDVFGLGAAPQELDAVDGDASALIRTVEVLSTTQRLFALETKLGQSSLFCFALLFCAALLLPLKANRIKMLQLHLDDLTRIDVDVEAGLDHIHVHAAHRSVIGATNHSLLRTLAFTALAVAELSGSQRFLRVHARNPVSHLLRKTFHHTLFLRFFLLRLKQSFKFFWEDHFEKMLPTKAVVFDMDGVLRVGSERIEGASEMFRTLEANGIRTMISTNECRYGVEELRCDLEELGVTIPEDTTIYTAGLAARDYLESKLHRFPDEEFCVGVIGELGLHEVLRELSSRYPNFRVEHTPSPTCTARKYVVVGTVNRIKIATLDKTRMWINAGARVLTTCCDMSDPSSKGDFTLGMPGHQLHILSYNNVGATKSYSTGKPHPIHAQAILRRFPDLKPSEILFVGDTLYTDIQLAEEAGFRSALVLTGNSKRGALKTYVVEPDYVIDSVRDLPRVLGLEE